MHKSIFVLAILSLFGLASCNGKDKAAPPVPPVPKNAVAGQITSAPCVYKEGKTEYAARCGFIYVPENRAKAGSRLIALPYQRILAQTKTPAEPVFGLTGGPGQSNMRFDLPMGWLIAERDIVLVGYRGVDGTTRLDCPGVQARLKQGGSLMDQQALAEFGEAFHQCAVRYAEAGIDLGGYTVLDVVDDVEAVRQALAYEHINLNSSSYGTRLALIYGWRYPERVLRSAMIAVNPPGRFRFDPALLDDQLRRYGALCAADAYCSARTKDLTGDMRRALDNMPARWLGVPIDRDVVLISTFIALFSTNGAASAFDMWIAAAKGDYSGMALLTATYSVMLPSEMVWGDYAVKGFSADFDPRIDYASELAPGRHLLGAPMNLLACAALKGGWPEHKIPAAYRTVQPSSVETLMLSGTLDVSTPAENARNELLPLMKNAKQVTLGEFAHVGDLVYYQPDATRRLLVTFYGTGHLDASAFHQQPVNFNPGWMSFPFLAKALVAAVLIVVGAVTGLVVWLFRRRRKEA